jgi:hypothetical protein
MSRAAKEAAAPVSVEAVAAAAPLPHAPPPATIEIHNHAAPSSPPRNTSSRKKEKPEPEPDPEPEEDFDFSLVEEDETDPLFSFVEEWNDGTPRQMDLIRQPDPPDELFIKPCNENKYYPRLTFRPESLVIDVQKRLRSGGKVRIKLIERGQYVIGGSLTFVVPDPEPSVLATVPEQHAASSSQAPTATPVATANDVVNDAIQVAIAARIKRLFDEPPAQSNPPPAKSELSDKDKLSLALIQESSLLPTVFGQITAAIAAANQNVKAAPDKFDRVISVFEKIPSLHSRAAKTIDRLLNRFLPDEASDDEGGDEEGSAEQTRALLTYLMNRCAANEPVTFQDEEILSFAEAHPDEWNELVTSLELGSVQQIMEAVASPYIAGDLAPTLTVVFKLEHAPAWIGQLKDLAVAQRKGQ